MSDANNTLNLITEGKTPRLLSLIPKGQSPKLYLDLIKTQIMGVDAKGNPRPDGDTLLFLYVAKRTGLDPLAKQIYAIYRWNSRMGREAMTIQASIDGVRVVAQRTHGYVGQDDVVFDDETKKYPGKATVTVYKQMGGQRVPFTASARWSEYCQTDNKGMPATMWAKMPYLMLGKCAEALALRKAFPNELSGVYTAEEMAQNNNPLGELTAPTRFDKKIEVLSGAPVEETSKSDMNIGNASVDKTIVIESAMSGAVDGLVDSKPITPIVVLGTTTTATPKDVVAMREALKPKTVEDMKKSIERAKEAQKQNGLKKAENPVATQTAIV